MRMTIPKSQGKQAYYDARKSNWGDIFPHPPKNPPQVRMQSSDGKTTIKGGDIGKRERRTRSSVSTYDALTRDIKDKKKRIRRQHHHDRDMFSDPDPTS